MSLLSHMQSAARSDEELWGETGAVSCQRLYVAADAAVAAAAATQRTRGKNAERSKVSV